MQLYDRLAITPDLQLIKNPAANPDADLIWIAGFARGWLFDDRLGSLSRRRAGLAMVLANGVALAMDWPKPM